MVTTKIKKLAILNISDHYARDGLKAEGRVIGVLLGVQTDGSVHVNESFELAFTEGLNGFEINNELLETKLQQCNSLCIWSFSIVLIFT